MIKISFLLFYLGIQEKERTPEVEDTVALLARLLNGVDDLNELRDNINNYKTQAKNEGIEV